MLIHQVVSSKVVKKFVLAIVAFVLLVSLVSAGTASVGAETVSVSTETASAASQIRSVYFRLYRWDGPMYMDVNANCSGIDVDIIGPNGYFRRYTRSSLNGNWRIWTTMQPRKSYYVVIACRGVARGYNVWYSGNTIRASYNPPN